MKFIYGKKINNDKEEVEIRKLADELDKHREKIDRIAENYRKTRDRKYLIEWNVEIRRVPRWED